MSFGELFITLLVALLAFGPSKLPMLARHLAKFVQQFQNLKQQTARFWEQQLQEQQLLENQSRAKEADRLYKDSSAAQDKN